MHLEAYVASGDLIAQTITAMTEKSDSFDVEFDLLQRQRRIIADELGVSPEEVHARALERIKHDVEIDAAKVAMFQRLVLALIGLLECRCEQCKADARITLIDAEKLQRGEL